MMKKAVCFAMAFLMTALLPPTTGSVVRAADLRYQGSYDLTFDETTTQELRQWAAIVWQWYDTGVIPPEAETFQFTNPGQFPPGFHPFNEAATLFSDLYAERIEAARLVAVGGYYTIWDLVQDDPEVRAQFRQYTLTGELPRALMGGPQWQTSKKLVPAGHTEPLPDDGLPEWLRNFINALRAAVDLSNLAAAVLNGLYQDDSWWPWAAGGFDCDDFADAMAGWLINHLASLFPGMQVEQLLVRWSDGKIGHVITVVTYNGYYWLIDAQSGEILGPFPVGTPFNPRPLLEDDPGTPYPDRYGLQPGDSIWVQGVRPVGDRPFVEPEPWWENPAMRALIQEKTGRPWSGFVPPGFP